MNGAIIVSMTVKFKYGSGSFLKLFLKPFLKQILKPFLKPCTDAKMCPFSAHQKWALPTLKLGFCRILIKKFVIFCKLPGQRPLFKAKSGQKKMAILLVKLTKKGVCAHLAHLFLNIFKNWKNSKIEKKLKVGGQVGRS